MRAIPFLVLASFGWGQTTEPDAVSVGSGGSVGLTGITWSHTVGTRPYRALYVMIAGLGASNTMTSVTYGGAPLTQVASCGGWSCEIWRLLDPPSGTADVVLRFPPMTQTYHHYSAGAISLFGVDDTAPENAVATSPNTCSTNISPTLINTRFLGVAINHNGYVSLAHGMAATLWNNTGLGAEISGAGYSLVQNTGSQSFGWGCSESHGISAIAVNPKVIPPAGPSLLNYSVAPARGKPVEAPNRFPAPVVASTQYQGPISGGDTHFCAWVGPGVLPGNFGGGSIICNYNDGTGLGCTSVDACLYRMTTYDPTGSRPATFANINTYASYGVIDGNCYDGTAGTPKTRALFSLPGLLFQPLGCLAHGTYVPRQWGLAVSPDGGDHWCNQKTYLAHPGSPGCDSSNWKADGDFPMDAAGFQWPTTSGNKAGTLAPIDFLCQDYTENCPVAEGLDPAYLYFMATSDMKGIYIHRVLKSYGMHIMNPANWDTWSYGSWVNNSISSGSDVMGVLGGTLNSCCVRMAYLAPYGKFAIIAHGGGSPLAFATAPSPMGPWTLGTGMSIPDTGYQFPSFIAGLCPRYDVTTGKITCTAFTNGKASGKDIYIREVELGPLILPFIGIR